MDQQQSSILDTHASESLRAGFALALQTQRNTALNSLAQAISERDYYHGLVTSLTEAFQKLAAENDSNKLTIADLSARLPELDKLDEFSVQLLTLKEELNRKEEVISNLMNDLLVKKTALSTMSSSMKELEAEAVRLATIVASGSVASGSVASGSSAPSETIVV